MTPSPEPLLAGTPSDSERRMLVELLAEAVPITWECLEDMGLFRLFRRLPTASDRGYLAALAVGGGR
jgi:hypothetical protein